MNTKTLLRIMGSIVFLILLSTLSAKAQIPIQGLESDHEGVASWDADGSGPEPEAYGHIHPFGFGSSLYYTASRDYVVGDPDAAMAHFLDGISGFPLFVQALSNNGFTTAQVKIKYGLTSEEDDIEGEDWFTFVDAHYFNRYHGSITIILKGVPIIYAHLNFNFISYHEGDITWSTETNFTTPFNIYEGDIPGFQEVAEAFIADMNGEELRLTTVCQGVSNFENNGRIGFYFDIISGYLEKGLPELTYEGYKADHEGVAAWNSDGTGPEPPRTGHSFTWNGTEYGYLYYAASRDYDSIDPDPGACMAHFTEAIKGFPNLAVQLAYRGYTVDQLKIKIDTLTLGDDIEGEDWGINTNSNTHWFNYYGGDMTFAIAGEAILSVTKDTAFHHDTLGNSMGWSQYSNYTNYRDISSGSSSDARYVAKSLFKDLSGHSITFMHEGCPAYESFNTQGRDGSFHNIWGSLTGRQPEGTHIWGPEVSGLWDLAGSPYIVMDYIIIPDGETLVIEPDVEVQFNSIERFDVQGCLKAVGTDEKQILFTAVDDDIPWGGIFFEQTPATNDTSKFVHCIFEYAYGYDETYGYNCGGALDINMVDKMIISNCTFRHNSADKVTVQNFPAGGALAIFRSSFRIDHCIFHDNSSIFGGAMMIGLNSDPVIDNCLFYNNSSTPDEGSGGAVIVWSESYPHFVNCTFADNYAVDDGGAVELEISSEASFTNCIFWDNTSKFGYHQISIWPDPPPVLNIYYCDIEGGTGGITPGFFGDTVNIYDFDPEFVTWEDYPYVQGDASPCINSGTLNSLYMPENWTCCDSCLCGNPRVLYDGIDLGCYEWIDPGSAEEHNVNDFSVNIYPNPVNTQSVIEFFLESKASVELTIIDITGSMLFKSEASEMHAGRNQIVIHAENLPSGLYLCSLRIGNEMITKKIIKY